MKRTRIFLVLFLFCLPLLASAYELKLNLEYPSFGGFRLDQQTNGLSQIIGWLYYALVGLSGAAAFAMFVVGGVRWLSSSGNPSLIGDARDQMQNALLGLLLVLSSVLIIRIINPELTILKEPTLEKLVGMELSNPLPDRPEYRSIFEGAGGSAALGGGTCQYGAGICSAENLLKYFPDPIVAAQASKVCQAESAETITAQNLGCLTVKGDSQEAREHGSRDYSIGLFQINLLAHCTDENGNTPFIDTSGDFFFQGNCAIAPGKEKVVKACEQRFKIAEENITFAKQLFENNGSKWKSAWGAAIRCDIP
ncbi:MAG: hypothetical protein HYV78_00960 [Candidatus Wildermuthbacteria bacterium]|nr:hypothetical protein [Candidatus Wildermuthbacteria bacterium]